MMLKLTRRRTHTDINSVRLNNEAHLNMPIQVVQHALPSLIIRESVKKSLQCKMSKPVTAGGPNIVLSDNKFSDCYDYR